MIVTKPMIVRGWIKSYLANCLVGIAHKLSPPTGRTEEQFSVMIQGWIADYESGALSDRDQKYLENKTNAEALAYVQGMIVALNDVLRQLMSQM